MAHCAWVFMVWVLFLRRREHFTVLDYSKIPLSEVWLERDLHLKSILQTGQNCRWAAVSSHSWISSCPSMVEEVVSLFQMGCRSQCLDHTYLLQVILLLLHQWKGLLLLLSQRGDSCKAILYYAADLQVSDRPADHKWELSRRDMTLSKHDVSVVRFSSMQHTLFGNGHAYTIFSVSLRSICCRKGVSISWTRTCLGHVSFSLTSIRGLCMCDVNNIVAQMMLIRNGTLTYCDYSAALLGKMR